MNRIRYGRVRRPSAWAAALRQNRRLLLLGFLLLLGMAVGALTLRFGGLHGDAADRFRGYFAARSGQSVWATAGYSALSALPFLAAAFFSGLCLCGAPAALLLPLFRGLGLGLMGGCVYLTYGLRGVGFYALIILPPALLSCAALICACREALAFSLRLFAQALPDAQPVPLWDDLKRYGRRFLPISAVMLASVAVDTGMTAIFIRFFTF